MAGGRSENESAASGKETEAMLRERHATNKAGRLTERTQTHAHAAKETEGGREREREGGREMEAGRASQIGSRYATPMQLVREEGRRPRTSPTDTCVYD
jgi:hypothetical protein